MSHQLQNVQEMHDNFTEEQHRFYSDYFKRYNIYLSFITPPPEPHKIEDDKLYETFENALLDKYPDDVYKHEPFRYKVYHFLFRYSPWKLRDYFVTKFMQMPEYRPSQELLQEDDFETVNCDWESLCKVYVLYVFRVLE